MREFIAQGVFEVRDRGRAYSIDKSQLPKDLWKPSLMNGEIVQVTLGDKVIVGKVVGVEMCAINCSPDHPYRLNFAICLGKGLDEI